MSVFENCISIALVDACCADSGIIGEDDEVEDLGDIVCVSLFSGHTGCPLHEDVEFRDPDILKIFKIRRTSQDHKGGPGNGG